MLCAPAAAPAQVHERAVSFSRSKHQPGMELLEREAARRGRGGKAAALKGASSGGASPSPSPSHSHSLARTSSPAAFVRAPSERALHGHGSGSSSNSTPRSMDSLPRYMLGTLDARTVHLDVQGADGRCTA